MGKKNGQNFDDKLPMCEIGELLETTITEPKKEKGIITKLVCKQALTLPQFCNLFFRGEHQIKKYDSLGNIKTRTPIQARIFGVAEKSGYTWSPHGKNNFIG